MRLNIKFVGFATATFLAFGALGYTLAQADEAGDEQDSPTYEVVAGKGEVGQDQEVQVRRDDGEVFEWTVERGYTADGRTYGSQNDPEYGVPMPDLVATLATNGKEGYTTLEDEARAFEELDDNPQLQGLPIPVYAKDGKTVIGEYIVGVGGGLVDLETVAQDQ